MAVVDAVIEQDNQWRDGKWLEVYTALAVVKYLAGAKKRLVLYSCVQDRAAANRVQCTQ